MAPQDLVHLYNHREKTDVDSMLEKIKRWLHRRRFQEGKTLSRFVAMDVRRDILIVSAARIEEGIITAHVRTTNVLYAHRGLVAQPEFEPAKEIRIDELWHWTGKSWGGLSDGTSIVDHVQSAPATSSEPKEDGAPGGHALPRKRP